MKLNLNNLHIYDRKTRKWEYAKDPRANTRGPNDPFIAHSIERFTKQEYLKWAEAGPQWAARFTKIDGEFYGPVKNARRHKIGCKELSMTCCALPYLEANEPVHI